jgi:hypothetical protein
MNRHGRHDIDAGVEHNADIHPPPLALVARRIDVGQIVDYRDGWATIEHCINVEFADRRSRTVVTARQNALEFSEQGGRRTSIVRLDRANDNIDP